MMPEKLILARELASCLCGIELRQVSDEDGSLQSLIRDTFYGSVFPVAAERGIERYLSELEPGCVYQLGGILGMHYIVIRMHGSRNYIIAGPCREAVCSESRIRSTLRSYKLSDAILEKFIAYWHWQPVLAPEKLHQLGILLARHVLAQPEPIPYRRIHYHWNRMEHPQFIPPEEYVEQSQIRQIEMRYEASAALTEAVKHGNLTMALRMIQGIPHGLSSMIRNPDPLRNAQNMGIVLNTQLRHAMEERKIHPYRLDQVSHEIATHIETLKTLDEAAGYFHQIIRRYCELALEKNYSHLEPLSRQAVVYIKNHLTDNLTVKETAKALLVNANYLSGKFHQEVGMTFTDFVNQQRTEQAASLLRHTNLQIQQIAAAVGYNNASHFARQFLRFYSLTPRDYRKRNKL